MRSRRRVWPLLLALCAGALGACQLPFRRPPRPIWVHAWRAADRELTPVRRVVVLQFIGESIPDQSLASLREAFLAELATAQVFEAVPLPDGAGDSRGIYEAAGKGSISSAGLVEIGKRYGADGVLLARVTSFRPWLPPVIGLNILLVSVHTGAAVWTADQTFDASREDVREDVLHYSVTKLAPDPSLHEAEMMLLSPRRFARYASARIVASLLLASPAPPRD